jgi:hypothetical protein
LHLKVKQIYLILQIFDFLEVENALNLFVYNETNKCTALLADKLIKEKLFQFGNDSSKLAAEINIYNDVISTFVYLYFF